MIKTNKDIFEAGSELYHRLIETKEITEQHAIAGAKILTVLQRSILLDILKTRMEVGVLPIEEKKVFANMHPKLSNNS